MARVLNLLTVLAAVGQAVACLPSQQAELDTTTASVPPGLVAYDAQGQSVSLDNLPRRPLLVLSLHAQISEAANELPEPWLLSGSADPSLLADLDKLPLTAAHEARKLSTRRVWRGSEVVIAPEQALLPGALYTLALPRAAAKLLPSSFVAALHVDPSPQAGAALRATYPAAETSGVPSDLALALWTFDGAVEGAAQGVWVEDEAGLAHPGDAEARDCSAYDDAAFSCIAWRPATPLVAGARYTLRSGRALTDARGGPVAEVHAAFTTRRNDATPGEIGERSQCALDEVETPFGCALVSDDRILLRLFHRPATRITGELAGKHFAVLPSAAAAPVELAGLRPDTDYALTITELDARLEGERRVWMFRTPRSLARLTISEVNADPAGREPSQEYVELWNYGDTALSLEGLWLSDDAHEPGIALPAVGELQPDARALLVADSFEPNNPADVAPAVGCVLAHVGKAVTRAGLANAGEKLYLRDAENRRLSATPDTPAPKSQHCLARDSKDPRTGEPGSFVLTGECTPGW